MQQSGSADLAATVFFAAGTCGTAIALSCFSAFALRGRQPRPHITHTPWDRYALERVRMRLPLPPHLNLDLHALVNVLLPTLVVDSQLQQVPIPQLARPRLCIRRRQPHVVQKRPAARLCVLDEEPPARLCPDLCVRTRHHLALERQLVRAQRVRGRQPQSRPVREPANPQRSVAFADVPTYRVEPQRPPRVQVWYEADAVTGRR